MATIRLSRCRLNKFLAQTTALSRRAADRAIVAGEVRVNRAVITQLGATIDPARDRVEYQGGPLRAPRAAVYLAFYKPKNTLVTKHDPRGRSTIWQRLERYREQCNAIGRLDFESEGLLLVTNDGRLIQRLTHPRHGVAKIYHVKVRGIPNAAAMARFTEGLRIGPAAYQPVGVTLLRRTDQNAWLELILHEGKYRQIRAMCDAIGHPVLKLKRVAVGPIRLGALQPGQFRKLTPRERAALSNILIPVGAVSDQSPRQTASLFESDGGNPAKRCRRSDATRPWE